MVPDFFAINQMYRHEIYTDHVQNHTLKIVEMPVIWKKTGKNI